MSPVYSKFSSAGSLDRREAFSQAIKNAAYRRAGVADVNLSDLVGAGARTRWWAFARPIVGPVDFTRDGLVQVLLDHYSAPMMKSRRANVARSSSTCAAVTRMIVVTSVSTVRRSRSSPLTMVYANPPGLGGIGKQTKDDGAAVEEGC